MKEEADNGDILSQEKIKVLHNDNAMTLYEKLIKVSILQIEKFLPKLINKKYKIIKQDETKANNCEKGS